MSVWSNTVWGSKLHGLIITQGKFVFLRRAVWAFLAFDILATLAFISVISAPSQDVDVWFETGIPSNFIMIKTFSPDKLTNVEVILDGRYFFTRDELAPGTSGLQIENDFLSADETVPVDGYRPDHVELKIGSDAFNFRLGPKKKRRK